MYTQRTHARTHTSEFISTSNYMRVHIRYFNERIKIYSFIVE